MMRLLFAPFEAGFEQLHRADLAGAGDVGAAIGLEIQPDDIDGANLLNALRQKIDLCTDQIGNLEGLSRAAESAPRSAGRRRFSWLTFAMISCASSFEKSFSSKSSRPSSISIFPPVTCAW